MRVNQFKMVIGEDGFIEKLYQGKTVYGDAKEEEFEIVDSVLNFSQIMRTYRNKEGDFVPLPELHKPELSDGKLSLGPLPSGSTIVITDVTNDDEVLLDMEVEEEGFTEVIEFEDTGTYYCIVSGPNRLYQSVDKLIEVN